MNVLDRLNRERSNPYSEGIGNGERWAGWVEGYDAARRIVRAAVADTTEEDRLTVVRRYVEGNRDVWSDDPTDQFALAIADVYQKVLNVIDTGEPLAALASTPETERRTWQEWDALSTDGMRIFDPDGFRMAIPADGLYTRAEFEKRRDLCTIGPLTP